MTPMKRWLAGSALLCALFCGVLVAATTASDEERARALLERAVAYYQQEGERAFAAFSRVGPFSEDDLYVCVVDRQGTMRDCGGPPRRVTGRAIPPLLDAQLQLGSETVLAQPGTGQIQEGEYRWINWRQGRVERKKAFYQILDAHILAVGYYIPRSAPADAQNMLERVADALKDNAEQTIEQINQLDSQI